MSDITDRSILPSRNKDSLEINVYILNSLPAKVEDYFRADNIL